MILDPDQAAPRFCPFCDVVLDLHPWPDDDVDPGCGVATAKADLLDAFGFLIGDRR